jgi:hypothetical protein
MAKRSAQKNVVESYFKRNPQFNSLVSLCAGVGLGILLTHTVVDPHPLRWGLGLVVLGAIGYAYPWALKK